MYDSQISKLPYEDDKFHHSSSSSGWPQNRTNLPGRMESFIFLLQNTESCIFSSPPTTTMSSQSSRNNGDSWLSFDQDSIHRPTLIALSLSLSFSVTSKHGPTKTMDAQNLVDRHWRLSWAIKFAKLPNLRWLFLTHLRVLATPANTELKDKTTTRGKGMVRVDGGPESRFSVDTEWRGEGNCVVRLLVVPLLNLSWWWTACECLTRYCAQVEIPRWGGKEDDPERQPGRRRRRRLDRGRDRLLGELNKFPLASLSIVAGTYR